MCPHLNRKSKNNSISFSPLNFYDTENTSLSKQLSNFQSANARVGLIVDEYGDIEGIITLRAILEVIVGEITSDSIDRMDIMPQADGSFMIEGSVMIRDINCLYWCNSIACTFLCFFFRF